MSEAKRCDRCGNYYQLDISNEEDNVVGVMVLDKYGRGPYKYDLCRECRKQFNDWWNEGEE